MHQGEDRRWGPPPWVAWRRRKGGCEDGPARPIGDEWALQKGEFGGMEVLVGKNAFVWISTGVFSLIDYVVA